MEQNSEIAEIGVVSPKEPQLQRSVYRSPNPATSDTEQEEKRVQTLRSSEEALEEMIKQAFADDDAGLTRTIRSGKK